MVNENCKIVKENIPPQSVLTRLANRLFKVSGIYDAWTDNLRPDIWTISFLSRRDTSRVY